MPKCPECGRDIYELLEILCQFRENAVFLRNADAQILDIEERGIRDEELVHYECPKCSEWIFFNYPDAFAFLKSE